MNRKDFLAVLAICTALAACSTTDQPSRIEFVQMKVPPAVLVLPPEPVPPPRPATKAQTGTYALDLYEDSQMCRVSIETIRQLNEGIL